MARHVAALALVVLMAVAASAVDLAPASTPTATPSSPEASLPTTKPSVLAPYAMSPAIADDLGDIAPTGDSMFDSDAAPIGAPTTNYPPEVVSDGGEGGSSPAGTQSGASSIGVTSVFGSVSLAAAASYFIF